MVLIVIILIKKMFLEVLKQLRTFYGWFNHVGVWIREQRHRYVLANETLHQ